MKQLLSMIPGMAQHRKELEQFDDREIDKTEAIIRSMTPFERRNPKIIDGSRRARIAAGSGCTVSAVNSLLQRFEQAAKFMKRMGAGVPGMGGVPGFGGPSQKSKRKDKKNSKKKGSKSGNPMRREAEQIALRARLSGAGSYNNSTNSYDNNNVDSEPNMMNVPSSLKDLLSSQGQNNLSDLPQMPDLPPNLGEGLSGLFGSK